MHYKQEIAVVKCSLFAEASGLSGKSNRRRKVAGMERWKSLAVASVGILAMPVMFASNSYAVPPPIIELIPSQYSVTVDEGQSFDITITVKNISDMPFTVDWFALNPVFQSGDQSDELATSYLDWNSPCASYPTLNTGESTWVKYNTSTINDGDPYNDGDGYWFLNANINGTFDDGTLNGMTYDSPTLAIPVTVHDVAPTPEPSTYALMGVGGLLLALRLRKSGIASMFTA
jgi:hypothetical protein